MTENELKLNKATKKAGSKQTVSSLYLTLKSNVDTRDAEMLERDKHKAKTSPEETKRYNDQMPKINNESAKIGEKAADVAIKIQYPGYTRIHPTSLDSFTSVKGNFDMVYKNADGDVIIVEVKGGSSPLDTTEYAEAITESMETNTNPKASTDRKAAKAITKAAKKNKNIKYLHVKTPIKKTGAGSEVGEVEISEFDIDKNALRGRK